MKAKTKQSKLTQEEIIELNLKSQIKDIEIDIKLNIMPLNPTRFFEVGEEVSYGAHSKTLIREIFHDGLYYKTESFNTKVINGKEILTSNIQINEWYRLFKSNNDLISSFAQEETYYLKYSNSDIDSLLHKVYSAGVDFDVDYQRDYVWDLEDKIALIDSIFNNIDIGKFVFVQRDFGVDDKLYEILDGKQRLSTLCDFYEDRFQYRGFYFSELTGNDKRKFRNHNINYATLDQPDRKTILETFVKLNTTGRVMDVKHLDDVKNKLKNIVHE